MCSTIWIEYYVKGNLNFVRITCLYFYLAAKIPVSTFTFVIRPSVPYHMYKVIVLQTVCVWHMCACVCVHAQASISV